MTRHLHYTEAMREAAERNEIIVNIGDIVVQGRGASSWFAMIAWCGERPEDARLVCILSRRGEGFTGTGIGGLRYMGWIDDFTAEELDTILDDVFETLPETDVHGYALDASIWRKWDAPYWEWFRDAA